MKQFYFIMFSTFMVGFVAGVYVFFISKPEVEVTGPSTPETSFGIEVVAEMYGGCQMLGALCPSYRITNDGSYTYLVPQLEGEDLRFEDSLTGGQMSQLEDLIDTVDLADVEESEFTGTCPIAFDGPAFRYEITVDGVFNFIDTCESDAEGQLFETLGDYFEIFSRVHGN